MSDTSRQPVIVAAARTPIGKFLGALAPLSAPELGGLAIKEAVRRAGVPAEGSTPTLKGVHARIPAEQRGARRRPRLVVLRR